MAPGSLPGRLPGRTPALHPPGGIEVGPDGHIYFVDFVDGRILILSPDGALRTHPGTGVRVMGIEEGRLRRPHVLAIGPNGHVYFANDSDYVVRRVTPGGDIEIVAGAGTAGHDDGPALEATFTDLQGGIDFDNLGNLYITDGTLLRRLTYDGRVETVARDFGDLHFGDIAAAAAGAVYVADPVNHCVWRVEGSERAVFSDDFEQPVAVAVGDAVYVADFGRRHIYKIADGVQTRIGASYEFKSPSGVAVAPGGTVYVMDDADRSGRGVREDYNRVARIVRIRADDVVEVVIDPGGPGKPISPYRPEVSGSRVPVVVGGAIMALSIAGLAIFLWRNRRRLTS